MSEANNTSPDENATDAPDQSSPETPTRDGVQDNINETSRSSDDEGQIPSRRSYNELVKIFRGATIDVQLDDLELGDTGISCQKVHILLPFSSLPAIQC